MHFLDTCKLHKLLLATLVASQPIECYAGMRVLVIHGVGCASTSRMPCNGWGVSLPRAEARRDACLLRRAQGGPTVVPCRDVTAACARHIAERSIVRRRMPMDRTGRPLARFPYETPLFVFAVGLLAMVVYLYVAWNGPARFVYAEPAFCRHCRFRRPRDPTCEGPARLHAGDSHWGRMCCSTASE